MVIPSNSNPCVHGLFKDLYLDPISRPVQVSVSRYKIQYLNTRYCILYLYRDTFFGKYLKKYLYLDTFFQRVS